MACITAILILVGIIALLVMELAASHIFHLAGTIAALIVAAALLGIWAVETYFFARKFQRQREQRQKEQQRLKQHLSEMPRREKEPGG